MNRKYWMIFIGQKMNKNAIITVVAALLFGVFLHGQQDGKEKIKSLKIAFYTEKIGLSSEEAKVFWPLYNDYEEKREALHRQERSEIRDRIAGKEDLSESEATAILNRYLELEEAQEELDKAFYRNLAQKLSAAKAIKLFRAQHEFRRKLLREYGKRGGKDSPQP